MMKKDAMQALASTEGLFVVASAPAGWYEVSEESRRWFDGRSWTDHYAPVTSRPVSPEPALAIPDPVVVVASRADARGTRHPNHGFHLIMIIMTLGVWMPVWAVVMARVVVGRVVPIAATVPGRQTWLRGSGVVAPGSSEKCNPPALLAETVSTSSQSRLIAGTRLPK